MALDVDGYAILKAVADAPETFPDLRAEVAKTARTLVVKQLKAKTLALAGLRRVRHALGPETFALILDGLTDTDAKTVVTRLDKHHPDLGAAKPDWHRRRLAGLADTEEPAVKSSAPKTAAAAAEKKPKPQRALADRPFAATWDGKDHDAPAGKAKKRRK